MPTSETRSPQADSRVVLYVRDGCHLCEAAVEVVRSVCEESTTDWVTIDIDAIRETGPAGRALAEEYADLVPVVVVDGVRRGYWRLDADRVRRALATGGSGA